MRQETLFSNPPASWARIRLKTTIATTKNGVWGDEPDGKNDIICVRVADFDRARNRVDLSTPTLRAVEIRQRDGRVLAAGDLLLEKSGGGEKQPVGTVVLYDHVEPAVCSNFIARVVLKGGYDPRFLCYVHSALYGVGVTQRSIKQTTGIQNLDADEYLNERIAVPSYAAQCAIADALDTKTAAIDEVVAKKERLIQLLRERLEALIANAVTKGLDPHVAMTHSGIEWLENIPAHWSVVRIKHVARLESGHTPSRSVQEHWLDSNNIPWVSLNDTKRLAVSDYIDDTALHINELGLANSSARMLPARAVVFTRDATIGKAAITTRPMAVSQHIIAWLCGPKLLPEYLLRVFYVMEKYLERFTFGATLRTIGMDDVRTLVTPVPPLEEQSAIAAYAANDAARHDVLIKKIQHQIELLREYRQALVTEAVTGKLDIAKANEAAA